MENNATAATRNPLANMTEIARDNNSLHDDNTLHDYPPLPPSLFMGMDVNSSSKKQALPSALPSASKEELAAFIKEPHTPLSAAPSHLLDNDYREPGSSQPRQDTVSELGCFLATIGYIMCCSIGFPGTTVCC